MESIPFDVNICISIEYKACINIRFINEFSRESDGDFERIFPGKSQVRRPTVNLRWAANASFTLKSFEVTLLFAYNFLPLILHN